MEVLEVTKRIPVLLVLLCITLDPTDARASNPEDDPSQEQRAPDPVNLIQPRLQTSRRSHIRNLLYRLLRNEDLKNPQGEVKSRQSPSPFIFTVILELSLDNERLRPTTDVVSIDPKAASMKSLSHTSDSENELTSDISVIREPEQDVTLGDNDRTNKLTDDVLDGNTTWRSSTKEAGQENTWLNITVLTRVRRSGSKKRKYKIGEGGFSRPRQSSGMALAGTTSIVSGGKAGAIAASNAMDANPNERTKADAVSKVWEGGTGAYGKGSADSKDFHGSKPVCLHPPCRANDATAHSFGNIMKKPVIMPGKHGNCTIGKPHEHNPDDLTPQDYEDKDKQEVSKGRDDVKGSKRGKSHDDHAEEADHHHNEGETDNHSGEVNHQQSEENHQNGDHQHSDEGLHDEDDHKGGSQEENDGHDHHNGGEGHGDDKEHGHHSDERDGHNKDHDHHQDSQENNHDHDEDQHADDHSDEDHYDQVKSHEIDGEDSGKGRSLGKKAPTASPKTKASTTPAAKKKRPRRSDPLMPGHI